MRTIKTYVGEVGRTVYPVDFDLGYLDRSHVFVYMGDIPTEQLTYTWPNVNQIELTAELPVGVEFKIRRITPRHELFNDYENGAILEERNLDDSFKQTLMVLEEWEDGSYPDGLKMLNDIDMNGHRILNLPQPLLPHEPVRLQDLTINVSTVLEDANFQLIRSTLEPPQGDGKLWYNKNGILSVGDDGNWEPLTGGEASTGGGLIYDNTLPVVIEDGDTYANFETLETIYSYNDGDTAQYIAIPMLGGNGVGNGDSGSASGYSTFTSLEPAGSLVATGSTDAAHKVKAVQAGVGVAITETGTKLTLSSVVPSIGDDTNGAKLIVETDGTTLPKQYVKRLRAGTNVTLVEADESITISSTGSGGGGGGGVDFTNVLPTPLVAGTTIANFENMEFTFAYDDGSTTQYLAVPMLAGAGGSAIEGGGSGTTITIANAGTGADGEALMTNTGDVYAFKRIKKSAADNCVITTSGNSITIEPTIFANAGSTGAVLLKAKSANTIGVKRLLAGTNVTLTEGIDTVTIASTASGGGVTLGDTLQRLDTISASNNNVPVFTAAGASQFLTTASTRAMMGLSTVGNTIPLFTGTSTATLATLTPYMVSLLAATGVPSALSVLKITSGSNANGSWLRIATGDTSGVQICWHAIICTGTTSAYGAGFIGADVTWTFPQAFSAQPAVSGNTRDGVAAWIVCGSGGNSTVTGTFRQVAFTNGTANSAIGVTAIGFY